MRNMGDLQEVFFAQLDRLQAAETGEALDAEIRRSQQVVEVGKAAIANANTVIKAAYIADGFINKDSRMPKMLEA